MKMYIYVCVAYDLLKKMLLKKHANLQQHFLKNN